MIPRFEPIIQLSGCAIIDEQDRLLLLYKLGQGYYEFPGGKVESGESLEGAAIRETKEELGVDVEIREYLRFVDFNIRNQKMRSHKFLASIVEGQSPRVIETDKFDRRLLWMPITKHKIYPVAPNVGPFCERYIERKKD